MKHNWKNFKRIIKNVANYMIGEKQRMRNGDQFDSKCIEITKKNEA